MVFAAGVIGDLYAALAKMCGVQGVDPASVLLLVEIYNGKVHQKFTDMKETLADGIRGRITLLTYLYPSPDVGPASGGKELHVFQRLDSALVEYISRRKQEHMSCITH